MPVEEFVGPRRLRNLDHEITRNTIKRILAANGIEPAATRWRGICWETVLEQHGGAIAAADFLSVEALPRSSLVRFLVFFVIDLKSRRVKIAGIAPAPDGRLARVIPPGGRRLRWVIGEYVKHDRLERNHRGLGNELIASQEAGSGAIRRRERLGGLLDYSYREAA